MSERRLRKQALFNLGVFNKEQMLTIHGTGQYTIDLTQVKARDISLDEENYELTICIPHAKLHNVSYDPEKTEIGDLQRGWLGLRRSQTDSRTTECV